MENGTKDRAIAAKARNIQCAMVVIVDHPKASLGPSVINACRKLPKEELSLKLLRHSEEKLIGACNSMDLPRKELEWSDATPATCRGCSHFGWNARPMGM